MDILEKLPYDKIAEFPSYQRWLVVGLLHLLIFTGYFFFSYKGKQAKITTHLHTINTVEKELKKNRLRRKKLPKLEKKIARLNFKLLVARTQLPSSKEIPELLEQISNLGKSAGLDFLLFKPQKEVKKEFYAEIPVQMKVSGTFHEVVSFFDKLGSFGRIINVGNIQIGQAKKKAKTTVVQASASATTFMFTSSKADKKEKTKSYLNNKLGFSLKYQKNWKIREQLAAEELLISFSNKKDVVGASIAVNLIKDNISLEKIVEKEKKNAQIFRNNYKIEKEDEPSIANFKTYQVVATYSKDSDEFQESVTYISHKGANKIFKVTVRALKKSFSSYEKFFNESINSFWIHSKSDFKLIGEERFWIAPEETYKAKGKRDPFHSLLETEEMIPIFEESEEDKKRVKTPLELVNTMSLKLVGVIWGDGLDKSALIQTSDGKGFVVHTGTLIGKRKGKIQDITKDSIIVLEKQKYKIGNRIKVKHETVILKIKNETAKRL